MEGVLVHYRDQYLLFSPLIVVPFVGLISWAIEPGTRRTLDLALSSLPEPPPVVSIAAVLCLDVGLLSAR